MEALESVEVIIVNQNVDIKADELIVQGLNDDVLQDHDYSLTDTANQEKVTKEFAKCDECRKSRTKVFLPNSLLLITDGKNDGKTCDFCGAVMEEVAIHKSKKSVKKKNYVQCEECDKTILKDSLLKHIQDVHDKSNKVQCSICDKFLAGPFSLKEHIKAIHDKIMTHHCPECQKGFSHLSNMNRHIRLVHQNMVVSSKYVNCHICQKVVKDTSLKKHIKAIHERTREHVCSYCNKAFSQRFTLKEHISAKHVKQYEHKCALCHRQFAHKTNFTRHMRTVHSDSDSVALLEKGQKNS